MLDTLATGPQATKDLRNSLRDLLKAFRTGRNSIVSKFFIGNRVEKILLRQQKADHIPQSQHKDMAALIQAFVDDAARAAQFSGAQTASMAIASLRSTTETEQTHNGRSLECVRGTDLETGKQVALFPESCHKILQSILSEAEQAIDNWSLSRFFDAQVCAPKDALRAGEGMAHIRLDQAAQFLFGDKL